MDRHRGKGEGEIDKATLRRRALDARDGLSEETRIEKSMAIADHGAGQLTFEAGTIVAGFMPIRSEPDPRPLMASLAERGARLCLPVVLDSTTIVFRELIRGATLVPTGFGTLGPDADAAVVHPGLMLVPLAAFDRNGHRIGYGAGHYDRAIARQVAEGIHPRLVGIAFDLQEIDAVPTEPHDHPLDCVLTETGLRAFATDAFHDTR
ncbi:5-formyltetrahydrofolate cyclo-ligase [Pararhizobium mangrovi]|uniref:5-formyltetrahydrofolate cyclo-ligase n=1 Tax=Pararhizobium mangrovi TaxID=2590452 RepID=A0A506UH89_9HYPH|nr:5-formyltetrahydrofolate cyclo-ligase [Pararhizobium mangrovi]TPW32683.1 5-formyltetrahydrofolate cyclo-ligase [Pararhizobium mangrovi]